MNLNVSCDRSFARRAQNPNIADVIFQVEPEIKIFWLPISLLFSSKIILTKLQLLVPENEVCKVLTTPFKVSFFGDASNKTFQCFVFCVQAGLKLTSGV